MTFDLTTPVRTVGRAKRDPAVAYVRDLTLEDLELLKTEKGVKAPGLKRIRDVHHALARALSSGMSEYEASLVTGYCASRISILKDDPSFKELLEFYRKAIEDKTATELVDLTKRFLQTATMAQEELQDRLEQDPGSFENDELRKLVETMADRSGHAKPTGKSVTLNVNMAGRLEAARKRVEALPETLDVEHSAVMLDAQDEEPVHE